MADSNLSDSVEPSMDYSEIVVIRHGETEWNAQSRFQGQTDVELNDYGRQQAAAVAERLSKEEKISAIYASDLKRASETAEIIAKTCGSPEVIKDPALRERHMGDLEGVQFDKAAKSFPEAYQDFVSRRRDQAITGGGESIDQVYTRCVPALQKIGDKHKGERVVVVTHGGVLRQFHKHCLQPGKSARKRIEIPNTGVSILHLAGDEWTLTLSADDRHLDQIGYLQ